MEASELAQVRAESAGAIGFERWTALRRVALVLYFASLIAWSAVYGIPVQREAVIAWVCGALACGSIGRSPREIGVLVRDWFPLVALFAAYDLTRGAADSLGIGVHVHTMIDFDRFVFFGTTPTEWLQAHVNDPAQVNALDVAFTLTYTSYFIVPFAVAGALWIRDRLGVRALCAPARHARVRRGHHLHRLSRRAAVDGGPAGGARPDRAHDLGRLAGDRRRHGRAVLQGSDERQPGRGGAVVAFGVLGPGRDVPVGPGSAVAAPAGRALSARHGPDAHGHGRALLLRHLLGWCYAAAVMAGWAWWERRRAPRARTS